MSRKVIVPLLILLVLRGSAPALPLDQDDNLENLGVFTPFFFAELQDVELMGENAYVFGVGGLAVIDLSRPQSPEILGRYEPPGHPYQRFYRGAVEGDLALGGGREDLLSVMNLSGGGDPTLVATHGTPGQSYEGVVLRNGVGYACRHADGLEIITFDSNKLPISESQVTTLTNSWDVALLGNYAYVADGIGGLAVVNVADLASPVHLSSLPTSGSASDVVLGNNLAVVSCGSAGIDVFTLADPSAPVLVGHANTSGLAITSAIIDNTVYVADWDDVEAFDLSDPANPVPAGGENTPIRAMGLAAKDGMVVVADWSRLRIYKPGPSSVGDIEVPIQGIEFGSIPVGASRDTTILIGNTGGSTVTISEILEFSDSYSIITPAATTIAPGQTYELGIRFQHLEPGYAGTFLRITSDDPDEGNISFPLTSDDNPNNLDIGEAAPNFQLADMGGVEYSLQENLGRVVVVAFFANW